MRQDIETRDVITVRGVYEEEIPAISVDLIVDIRGSSLLTGASAISKAREVAQLVSELKSIGLADNDIKLQGVSAEVSSGFLGKSSSATYSLCIHCIDLEKLADILGVITSQKSTKLHRLKWLYNDGEATYQRWLPLAIENANSRAKIIAAGLGVKILGVYSFSEVGYGTRGSIEVDYSDYHSQMREASKSYRPITTADIGLEIAHTLKVFLTVEVKYSISGFEGT